MTKKHFISIAEALRETNASARTIAAIANALRKDNPRFDSERFIEVAAGQRPVVHRKLVRWNADEVRL